MKIYFDDPEYDGQFLRTLPTFVAEAENDRGRGGGKDLYDALQCPKEYVLFTTSEGAGEHCEAGGREVFFQKVFDWLDATMAR